MNKPNGNFKGLWIPSELWFDDRLTLQEKCFIVQIQHLDNGEDGCYANNEYFSHFFKISKVRVSQIINHLVDIKVLESTVLENMGNKRKLKTLLNFHSIPSQTKVKDPLKEKFKTSDKNLYEGLKETFKHKNRFKKNNNTTTVATPIKQTEVETKGVPEWYVKCDTIYLANTMPLMHTPAKKVILQQIIEKTLPNRPDRATSAFILVTPPSMANYDLYSRMLMPYGIAKVFHQKISEIRTPEKYKVIRETKVEKSIDIARQLLQIDKRSPSTINDVIAFMFQEDGFWKETIYSIDAFRKYFDKIYGKMETSDKQIKTTP